jgi:acetyl esterase
LLDAEAREYLRRVAETSTPPLAGLTAAQAREVSKVFEEMFPWDPRAEVEARDAAVPLGGRSPGSPSPPSGSIPVRIIVPKGPASPSSSPPLLPVLVYFHGGGWVLGDHADPDIVRTCSYLAAAAGCAVVSVGYRLAPEHRFPTPAEDAYAALLWVSDHAGELGFDPSRIAVGGDSAGGNLAAVVSLMARDRGGPRPVHQMLVYPVIDHSFETESYRTCGDGYGLATEEMRWFWDHYLRSPADGGDPYASPIRAKDLSGLPPAFVFTAGYDPLRDEGEAYGARLRASGVPTVVSRHDGTIHGCFTLPFGDRARAEAAAELRRAFSPPAS